MAQPKSKPVTQAQIQTDPRGTLAELQALGLTAEQIVVYMGQYLGGSHPSVQTFHRWKAGTTVPSRGYAYALAQLHQRILASIAEEERQRTEAETKGEEE